MADRRPEPQEDPGRHRPRRRAASREEELNNNNDPPPLERELPIPVPPGADLTYAQLLQLPAQDPVPEVFAPDLIPAQRNPTHVTLTDHDGNPLNNDPDGPPPIALVAGVEQPTHAYAFLPDSQPIKLNHEEGWGEVRFGVVYGHVPGDPPHVFRAPDPNRRETPPYVAIKILNKAVVQQHLRRGGKENPYKEICRYQELGDNVHVIRCEAMEDKEHLYIITPRCRPFVQEIFNPAQPLSPATIHAHVVQMLRILVYLEKHRIHHRDLSPDNLFLLPSGQLVLVDFAMSLRIPTGMTADGRTQRTLIKDQGSFGTAAWMAPEIFHRFPFDGVTADLWCVMHMTYNLLTVNLLYRRPIPADWSYRFFVLAGGLTDQGMNEQAMEVLQEIAEEATSSVREEIMNKAMAHLAFSPAIRTLLQNVFQNAPHERWTLGDVLRSDYVVNGPE